MISTVEKVLFLKGIDLFSQIPSEDLAQVAHIAEEVQFDKGQYMIREGEMGESLYMVVDGQVIGLKGDQALVTLGEKEVFGEMSILDSAPRSASVAAATDVSLLKIEREDFEDLMAEKMEIARGVIKVLLRRLRTATMTGGG